MTNLSRLRKKLLEELKAMLAPYPSEEMTCWPLTARVGDVKNNDPSLIEPSVLPSASGDADCGGQ